MNSAPAGTVCHVCGETGQELETHSITVSSDGSAGMFVCCTECSEHIQKARCSVCGGVCPTWTGSGNSHYGIHYHDHENQPRFDICRSCYKEIGQTMMALGGEP